MEAVTRARIQELVERLGLVAHPEGGYYAVAFKSDDVVHPADGRGQRRALTTIYFLLTEDQRSRWHRVASDEVWHFYEGAPLELLELTPDLARLETHRLGPLDGVQAPVRVIPAGHWQAARSSGRYTLVGCTVGPGFEFDDFAMMADTDNIAAAVRSAFPGATPWI